MRRLAVVAAVVMVASCNHSPAQHAPAAAATATVTLPPPSGGASAPAAASAAPARGASPERGPFRFVRGEPKDALGDYALRYWGPNGLATFTSAASKRSADVAGGPGDETLMSVGQYAVVTLPDRHGFFLRDLGEGGWVSGIEGRDLSGRAKKDVVLRYSLRDDQAIASEDWARWNKTHGKLPEVNAASHMVVEVWSFAGAAPALLFAHEHETWALCCGSEIGPAPPRISDDVELAPGRIVVRVRDAWRANAVSWKVLPLPDIPPTLAPWGGTRSRTFHFDASRGAFVE
jgi:hypothetical protein